MSGKFCGPLVTIVLDGVGEVNRTVGNAVALAHTPFWDQLRSQHRFTTLRAHGVSVGLPSDKDMGNSEVGHNVLGSGQVVDQGAKLVQDAIATGSLFEGVVWKKALDFVQQHHSCLHFIGLLSDGNVHSHIDHLIAMLDQAAQNGIERVRIHTLLDGRDVSPKSAEIYLSQLEEHLAKLNQKDCDYRIASGGGRMHITMDRYEADWQMVNRGWQAHVHGKGTAFPSAMQALESLRQTNPGIVDQDLPEFVIHDSQGPVGTVNDGDSVLFFNFRGDRAIEISQAFETDDSFDHFDRGNVPKVFYAGMMQYDGDLQCPANYLVGPPQIEDTLSELLLEKKTALYAISETQKYGHVTYFWNGNRSGMIDPDSETYVEIPSDTVSFDQRPWMKAAEITDALIQALQSGKYQYLRVNYANGDMVGHTGDLNATIAAMTCLDLQLHRLLAAVKNVKGVAMITADHGNCDEMFEFDSKGQPKRDKGEFKIKTSHSLSKVPFVLYDPFQQIPGTLHQGESLGIGNVAATVADILGFSTPSHWHPSLLNRNA